MILTSQLRGALGENLITNELLFRNWIPQNLNNSVSNAPNVDIVALKDHKKINIQVKTASLSQPDVRIGHGKKDNFLNSKDGPLADYIAFVRIESPKVYEVYIVPADIAEEEVKRCYHLWLERPKLDGSQRSEKFPSHIYFKHNKNRPDESGYAEKWQCYLDAWHLLEA